MARRRKNIIGVATTPPGFGVQLKAGDIPPIQQYDAATKSFEPNYTLTPLAIDVVVSILDGDNPLSNIDGSAYLTNQQWFEIEPDGSRSLIILDGGNPTEGYDGTQVLSPGPLMVCKNAAPGVPINLLFKGVVVYGPDRFEVEETFTVKCMDTTPSVQCKFDIPQVMSYNPIHDTADLPIKLIVLENGAKADKANFVPCWEVEREDGRWSDYGEEPTDYWLDVAVDRCSAVLHQDLMAEGVKIRVRLSYDKYGNPNGILDPEDLTGPFCRLDVVRSLGEYKYWDERPESLRGCDEFRLKMHFKDAKGDILNPDLFFTVKWWAGPSTRALGASDYIGEGIEVQVQTSRAGDADLSYDFEVD